MTLPRGLTGNCRLLGKPPGLLCLLQARSISKKSPAFLCLQLIQAFSFNSPPFFLARTYLEQAISTSLMNGGRILGRNWDKSLKSFLHSNSQSPVLTKTHSSMFLPSLWLSYLAMLIVHLTDVASTTGMWKF